MKSIASSTRFEPFGIVTMSPPAKEAVWPFSKPGSKVTPTSSNIGGFWSFEQGEVEVARAEDADLVGGELQVEVLAADGPRRRD